MLRISDDPSIPPPDLQTGMFWLETLAADEQVQREVCTISEERDSSELG